MSQNTSTRRKLTIKPVAAASLLTFLLANATLFGTASPLAIALCILSPVNCLLAVIVSYTVYFLLFSLNGYSACMLITTVITAVLRLRMKKLHPSVLGYISGAILSVLLIFAGLVFSLPVSGWITTAVILVGFTSLLTSDKPSSLNIPHLAVYAILVTSLSSINLPADLGCIFSAFMILHVARLDDISKSAVFSALSAASLLMAHPEQIYRALFVCGAGIILALISSENRIRRPLYFTCIALLYSVVNLTYSHDYLLAVDIFVASSMYVFTFDWVGDRLFLKAMDILCHTVDEDHISPSYAYELALSNIQDSLTESAESMKAPVKPRNSTVAYSRVCATCRKHSSCFADKSIDLSALDLSDDIGTKLDDCIRRSEITDAIYEANAHYDYIVDKQASCRRDSSKAAQFVSLANKLLSAYPSQRSIDRHLSRELTKRLCCFISSDFIAEVYADRFAILRIPENTYINSERIVKTLYELTGVRYSTVSSVKHNGFTYLSAHPRTKFYANAVTSGTAAAEGQPSGDIFTSCSYNENIYFILSDGMGTGEQAYMASKRLTDSLKELLTVGIDVESSVRLSSLVLKYSDIDESFATLDILAVNCSSGSCELYKAGAGDSYLLGEEVKSYTGGGYPIGIFDKCILSCEKFELSSGDEVILSSDGAYLTPKFVKKALMSCTSTEELCDMLLPQNTAEFHENDDALVAIIRFYKNS